MVTGDQTEPNTARKATKPSIGERQGQWLRRALLPSLPSGRNIDALDGLRGIAILEVITIHLLETTNLHFARHNGWLWRLSDSGVDLFFVLSGFLLFLPYARSALRDRAAPPTRPYLARRALRILPAYWASLALFLLFGPLIAGVHYDFRNIILHVTLLHNIYTPTYYGINAPYWTLAIEAQFYLLLPVIGIILVWALRAHRRVIAVAVFPAIVAVSVTAAALTISMQASSQRQTITTSLSTLIYLGVFSMGMLASFLFVAVTDGPLAGRSSRQAGMIVGLVGLALLGVTIVAHRSVNFIPISSGAYFMLILTGVAYAAILLGVLFGPPKWREVLSHPTIRFVGMISYSLYIWNRLFIRQFAAPVGRHVGGSNEVLALAVTILVGAILLVPFSTGFFLVFERPFFSARRRQHIETNGRS